MAVIAGKVAPRFMGAYNSSTTYQFYDAVTHNNKLYFCKESGTVGKSPSGATDDNWFLSLDGTFTDASSLGGETASAWQTKIDNIQTTSRATLSQAGWYRVAEYTGNGIGYLLGSSVNSCELEVSRYYEDNASEYHLLKLMSTFRNQVFDSLDQCGSTQYLTKVRYTYDSAKAYLEVYVNKACSIFNRLTYPSDYSYSWKLLDTPTLTSETVDGVTVTTTYDIPANASPVTDLDLDERTVPRLMTSGTDLNDCIDNGVYFFTGNATNFVNVPNSSANNGIMRTEYHSDVRIVQRYTSITQGITYERVCGSQGWKEWAVLATTEDLANNTYEKIVNPSVSSTEDPNTTTKPRIRTTHANCPTSDKPYIIDTIFSDGTGTANEKFQIAHGTTGNNYVGFRAKEYGSSWTAWEEVATTADLANYLPKTGGNISGDLMVYGAITQSKTDTSQITRSIKNSVRNVLERVYADGSYRLYDATNSKNIIESTVNGTNTFNGTATGNLPLSGGSIDTTLTTPLELNSKNSENTVLLRFSKNGVKQGYFGFRGVDLPIFINGAGNASRDLLHTGNSAKVVKGTSAPSDTTALWYDITNKSWKRYVDGAWQA